MRSIFYIGYKYILGTVIKQRHIHMHTKEEKCFSETFLKVLLECQGTVNICQLSNLCGQ